MPTPESCPEPWKLDAGDCCSPEPPASRASDTLGTPAWGDAACQRAAPTEPARVCCERRSGCSERRGGVLRKRGASGGERPSRLLRARCGDTLKGRVAGSASPEGSSGVPAA